MHNRTALLKQSDLTRYAKAMRAAEIAEFRVVVRIDGTHEIIVGPTGIAPANSATGWEDA
jgi:hypothetical protein